MRQTRFRVLAADDARDKMLERRRLGDETLEGYNACAYSAVHTLTSAEEKFRTIAFRTMPLLDNAWTQHLPVWRCMLSSTVTLNCERFTPPSSTTLSLLTFLVQPYSALIPALRLRLGHAHKSFVL